MTKKGALSVIQYIFLMMALDVDRLMGVGFTSEAPTHRAAGKDTKGLAGSFSFGTLRSAVYNNASEHCLRRRSATVRDAANLIIAASGRMCFWSPYEENKSVECVLRFPRRW